MKFSINLIYFHMCAFVALGIRKINRSLIFAIKWKKSEREREKIIIIMIEG